ncbi:MAG: hypothetical protein ACTSQE_09450 [Candidatus Heimdallarchaeaceae archaeon]
MYKEMKREIDTIPTPPRKILSGKSIWCYEDLLTNKPRASVKDIEQAYKIVKILKSLNNQEKTIS